MPKKNADCISRMRKRAWPSEPLIWTVVFVLLCVVHLARESEAVCVVPGWPPRGRGRSRPTPSRAALCFCAYAQHSQRGDIPGLCPQWTQFVSTDGISADKLLQHGAATVLGKVGGNATMERYGSVVDWAVDLGSGPGRDCDRTAAPACAAAGLHLLSIPRFRFVADCCGNEQSLAALLQRGHSAAVLELLHDMIEGALVRARDYSKAVAGGGAWRSCDRPGEEPTRANGCMAQCFHITPDVAYLHLHTTAGAKAVRIGPWDSGLGPAVNSSESGVRSRGNGRYNVCVCEPSEWQAVGRGHCPSELPGESSRYLLQATRSLCLNIAGAAQLAPSVCSPLTAVRLRAAHSNEGTFSAYWAGGGAVLMPNYLSRYT